ncbi:CheR family methyltransferase [Nitrospirillum iridis]|uniref:Chemotaxis protein methyltransferase CheR n=1 Tax=Nitrospirillum iridis TaxID=765888 RepID=A0A7X0AYI1_9PROT|nr:protein-glutamate O-methyltransferase CheR [Nitrospirillum iridis]MBB6251031.1 chemotaxis protein methyltransferase CheR [Nitrospirillum iridis]
MQRTLPDPLLAAMSDRLSARIGLYFPADRWSDMERGLERAAVELGYPSTLAAVQNWLSADPDATQLEALVGQLTVGETYFFREPKSFEALGQKILPDLIAERRSQGTLALRMWSAACCTGEEAYSLAMLLDILLPDRAGWTITLLATDVNPRFLRRAAEGVYGEWSFRGVDPAMRARYFTALPGGLHRISPHIARMVTFACHNLVDDPYPALESNTNAMDVILCRNVLMYFNGDQANRVVRRLARSLVDTGWLLPSSVDGAPPMFAPLTFVPFDGATVYRKLPAPASPGVAHHAPAPQPFPFTPSPPARAMPAAPPPTAVAPTPTLDHCRALYDQGRYGEAVDGLEALLAMAPADDAAMLLLARTYANQGRLADAAHWCQGVLDHNRVSAEAHHLLAMIQQERGDTAAAATSLQRALFLAPHSIATHLAMANLARGEGRTRDARKYYRNVMGLLEGRQPDEILPELEGMTVGRLLDVAAHAHAALGQVIGGES